MVKLVRSVCEVAFYAFLYKTGTGFYSLPDSQKNIFFHRQTLWNSQAKIKNATASYVRREIKKTELPWEDKAVRFTFILVIALP